MTELNTSLNQEYESLLFHRDALRKEAIQAAEKYTARFGELVNEVFRKKIECIEKKKKIAYCQMRLNKGMPINEAEMNSYIAAVMGEYYEELSDMILQLTAAKNAVPIPAMDVRKIRQIYRQLAKKIHPDVRPDLAEDETIRSLWNAIREAYTCNDLKKLEELRDQTELYLANIDDADIQPEIPDIEEKIIRLQEEIEKILTTYPYMYRFIITDVHECEERRKELEAELESYTAYSAKLDETLNEMNIVRFTS